MIEDEVITIRMDLSLKNAAKLRLLPVTTSCCGVKLVAFGQGFSNQVILGVGRSFAKAT